MKKTISLKKITCSKSFFSYWTDFCEPIIQEKTARTYDFFKLPWPLCFSVERLVLFSHFCMLFKYSCLQFPHHHSPHPSHPHFPPLILFLFGFVHVSFIHVPDNPSPFSPHHPSSPSPLVTVSLFLISMSLVILCLLICFVD